MPVCVPTYIHRNFSLSEASHHSRFLIVKVRLTLAGGTREVVKGGETERIPHTHTQGLSHHKEHKRRGDL